MRLTTQSLSVRTSVFRAVCAFLRRRPLHLLLRCVYPPFQSSREAAPVLPSLFTLLFSSIYSALQRPGAWRSKQLLHYGERGSSDCAAPPHSSLSLSLTAHHGCTSTPLIVTIKLGLPQCQSGFREWREPGQLSETFFENRKKPNSPSSAFD